MIAIDKNKCIGCGQCVRDCYPRDIILVDKKANPLNDKCFECGHCVAICPQSAVTLLNYDMGEVEQLSDIDYTIDPHTYLNHLKARRTIRRFKPTPLTDEELSMILDAGRFSPTGGNRQDVAYYISRNDIDTLRRLVLTKLNDMGNEMRQGNGALAWYGQRWLEMYDDYISSGKDSVFFNAPTVIAVSSGSPQAACIAAAHMETMIYALGLGMLYSGFSVRAVAQSDELKSFLKLKEGYSVYAMLVIGHPAVKYRRTVPRKPAEALFN